MSEDDRQAFFESYWSFGTNEVAKKAFLVQHTECENIKRQRVKSDESRKKQSLVFFVTVNGSKLRVCKEFFLKTLNISAKPVTNAYKRCDSSRAIHIPSRQGRHTPHHKLKSTYREAIIRHINSFPRIPSHYCRKTTRREYIFPVKFLTG